MRGVLRGKKNETLPKGSATVDGSLRKSEGLRPLITSPKSIISLGAKGLSSTVSIWSVIGSSSRAGSACCGLKLTVVAHFSVARIEGTLLTS